MKKPEKKKRQPVIQLHLWTLEQTRQALPYLTSILGTLRETRLEALTHDLRRQRIADKAGKPNRDAIIAEHEAKQAAQKADDQFMEALLEMQRMSVFLMDPIKGLALVPFLNGERVAWFIVDLFAEEHLQGWRYQEDPLETRRPMIEVETAPRVESYVV